MDEISKKNRNLFLLVHYVDHIAYVMKPDDAAIVYIIKNVSEIINK